MFPQEEEMRKRSGNISKNKKEKIEGSINWICLNNEEVATFEVAPDFQPL